MPSAPYQAVEDAFREGRIASEDSATLRQYLEALSNQPLPNEFIRHRDIVRGLTINHILLQRHISDLDRKNATTQKLVMALAAASLLASGGQIWYATRADDRAVEEAQRAAAIKPRAAQPALPIPGAATTSSSAGSPPLPASVAVSGRAAGREPASASTAAK